MLIIVKKVLNIFSRNLRKIYKAIYVKGIITFTIAITPTNNNTKNKNKNTIN